MNYQLHYDRLIERARNRVLKVYTESHHVIPRCIQETNDTIELTAEEHFVAHQLLVKIYPDNRKLVYAMNMMCVTSPPTQGDNRSPNKRFGWIRRKFVEAKIGITFSEETRAKLSKAKRGRTLSAGQKEKISLRHTGKFVSEETRKKISESKRASYANGKVHNRKGCIISEEHKRKIGETKQRKKIERQYANV